jgi:hypothetical protein
MSQSTTQPESNTLSQSATVADLSLPQGTMLYMSPESLETLKLSTTVLSTGQALDAEVLPSTLTLNEIPCTSVEFNTNINISIDFTRLFWSTVIIAGVVALHVQEKFSRTRGRGLLPFQTKYYTSSHKDV